MFLNEFYLPGGEFYLDCGEPEVNSETWLVGSGWVPLGTVRGPVLLSTSSYVSQGNRLVPQVGLGIHRQESWQEEGK